MMTTELELTAARYESMAVDREVAVAMNEWWGARSLYADQAGADNDRSVEEALWAGATATWKASHALWQELHG